MPVYLGIDIGGTKTILGLVDESGQIRHQAKLSTSEALHNHSSVIPSLVDTIHKHCKQWELSLEEMAGTVIGVPGIIQRETQTIESCPNLLELDGMALGPQLTAALNAPVWVENDVNLITLGEHRWGRGRGIQNMACIFVGTGIGCGLIVSNELYTGADGSAGEFGHISIEPEGKSCTCGGVGCLEMYCSGKALALAAVDLLGASELHELSHYNEAIRLNRAARGGHPAALDAIQRAFYYLGVGIANLVNIMNPRLIVLGGGIVKGWPEGLDIVRNETERRVRVTARKRLDLEFPVLGERAGLLGAAVYVKRMLRTH
jgi:glucokinase